MKSLYYFFRVPINPPSTIRIAKTIPAIGIPVFCIPTVLVVAAFTCGFELMLREFTPILFMLKVSDAIDALNR